MVNNAVFNPAKDNFNPLNATVANDAPVAFLAIALEFCIHNAICCFNRPINCVPFKIRVVLILLLKATIANVDAIITGGKNPIVLITLLIAFPTPVNIAIALRIPWEEKVLNHTPSKVFFILVI